MSMAVCMNYNCNHRKKDVVTSGVCVCVYVCAENVQKTTYQRINYKRTSVCSVLVSRAILPKCNGKCTLQKHVCNVIQPGRHPALRASSRFVSCSCVWNKRRCAPLSPSRTLYRECESIGAEGLRMKLE